MSLTKGKYVKYLLGSQDVNAHIDAVHARTEAKTGEIVRRVSRRTGCGGIIGLVHRKTADLNRTITADRNNREAVEEYRQSIHELLGWRGAMLPHYQVDLPYLHIAVHGMADKPDYDLELGTRRGKLCSEDVATWAYFQLVSQATQYNWRCMRDYEHSGSRALQLLRSSKHRSSPQKGFGQEYHILQVELSRWLRMQQLDAVVDVLAHLVENFGETFFPHPSYFLR